MRAGKFLPALYAAAAQRTNSCARMPDWRAPRAEIRVASGIVSSVGLVP